ncbi:hypothetical protein NMY22_g10942 [Coprinellus aureogranulatus]|nr:hypothetical protein NMY22_g10942 [Coprinellus aureogranulatus]
MRPYIRLAQTAVALYTYSLSTVLAQSVCTTDFRGTPAELELAQQEAIAEFGRLFLVEKDAQKAFDIYIPGYALKLTLSAATHVHDVKANILVPAMKDPSLSISHERWFAGQGYGLLHYRMELGGSASTVMDRFKFVGTCIVEHWDSVQDITGKETNPIAFF